MTRLQGKTALVTGGSRGIGRAIAERLAADGATVVISYLENALAADAVVASASAAAGGTVRAMQADLGSADSARRLFDQAQAAVGPLDIVVNNAGIAPTALIADTTDEDFEAVLAVNLKAPFILIREAAKRMRDGGRIVNISTLNTIMPGPGMVAYAASKAALEPLSRVAAFELGGRGITVNAVLPGATDTDLFRTNNPTEDGLGTLLAMTALGRIGSPADIADVVAFVVSEDARWLTGQTIRACGGLA